MGFTWTFKSGADEAWITDEVGVEQAGRSFQAGAQAMRIGALLGIGAAVGLAFVDLRLPIVAGGAVSSSLRSCSSPSCPRPASSRPVRRASLQLRRCEVDGT